MASAQYLVLPAYGLPPEKVTVEFDDDVEGSPTAHDILHRFYTDNRKLPFLIINHHEQQSVAVTICSPYGDVVTDVSVDVCISCGGRMHRIVDGSLRCESCGDLI